MIKKNKERKMLIPLSFHSIQINLTFSNYSTLQSNKF